MTLLWLKAFHLFFIMAWMAGLFYLPRLFVYHAGSDNGETKALFKQMERRLWYFVTPFALLTLLSGLGLILSYGDAWFATAKWLHIKVTLLLAVYAYHFYLFKLLRDFAADKNHHGPRFFRIINELPVLLLLAIFILAVVKPF